MKLSAYVASTGHIYCWHICGSSMVNKNFKWLFCFIYICSSVGSICGLQWQCIECSETHMYSVACICTGLYTINVKCMYTRVPVYIVDCSGFIGGTDTYIEVSYVDIH